MANQMKAQFVRICLPAARAAEAKYSIPRAILLTQAALESAWGRRAPGNNHFGIKAGKSWTGKTVDFQTHEVESGKVISISARFRAYDSIADSFLDYARLISTSGRYAKAYASKAEPLRYWQELQAGGYATDPLYAEKCFATYTKLLPVIAEVARENAQGSGA